MNLHERVTAKFLPLAIGKLKLEAMAAHAFATHIADVHTHIHIASQLCTAPNALKSATLDIMLERWLRALPEYAEPKQQLEVLKIAASETPRLDTAVALLLHTRIFEISISERKLSESNALQVASLLSRALPAFWLLAQYSETSEHLSQKSLVSVLQAALAQPLEFASEAAQIYLEPDHISDR